MARVALPCLVLLHTLGVLALVLDGMRPTRPQCPTCHKVFKSETGLRQHRSAMARHGETPCSADFRPPLVSSWSGRGARAAGMVQILNHAARLVGLSDSDSDGGLGGDGGMPDGGRSRDQSPVPAHPADGQAAPPIPAAVPVPAAPPAMPRVHTCTYTCGYVHIHSIHSHSTQIHADTHIYITYIHNITSIHTYTGRYRHIWLRGN